MATAPDQPHSALQALDSSRRRRAATPTGCTCLVSASSRGTGSKQNPESALGRFAAADELGHRGARRRGRRRPPATVSLGGCLPVVAVGRAGPRVRHRCARVQSWTRGCRCTLGQNVSDLIVLMLMLLLVLRGGRCNVQSGEACRLWLHPCRRVHATWVAASQEGDNVGAWPGNGTAAKRRRRRTRPIPIRAIRAEHRERERCQTCGLRAQWPGAGNLSRRSLQSQVTGQTEVTSVTPRARRRAPSCEHDT
eukprot:2865177-Prymnesium_polylepis.2